MKEYQTIMPLVTKNSLINDPPKLDALNRDFYNRNPEIVAKKLLGKFLVHKTKEGSYVARIVETEAYLGQSDPACHASVGYTPRTALFFGISGVAYIFVNYGIHHCLNAITSPPGTAGCVLIRAVEPIEGIDLMKRNRGLQDLKNLTNGPGKLTKAMAIDKSLNGFDLISSKLYIKNNNAKFPICKTIRIGITKAADLPMRFFIKNNEFVSGSKIFNSKGLEL